MIRRVLVFGLLLFNYAYGQELDPLGWSGVSIISDTTNNYYVSTTGTDTSSTGSYTNPFSVAKADTFFNYENKDSVFFLSGTYQYHFTANEQSGVTYCSYDLINRAKLYGADTISYAKTGNAWTATLAWVKDTTHYGYTYGGTSWLTTENWVTIAYYELNNNNAGLRFSSFQAPKNATIDSAKLHFKAYGSNGNTVNQNIYFCNEDNSAQITGYSDYNGRAVTSAVAWNALPAWTPDVIYQSPELKTILQTVVNRSGWSAGNFVQAMIKNNGGTNNAFRQFDSYNQGAGTAAYLVVGYTVIDSSQVGGNVFVSTVTDSVYQVFFNYPSDYIAMATLAIGLHWV